MPRKSKHQEPPPPDDPFRQKERVRREKGPQRQDWMTSSELSKHLNINPRTLRYLKRQGKIPEPAATTESGFGLWSPSQVRTILRERVPS